MPQKRNEWLLLNDQKPIWTRKSEDVTEEEYNVFYKHMSGDYNNPRSYKHFSVEGNLEFKALLYIPEKSPQNMFELTNKSANIKLYVRKVFISDKCDDLLPEWLNFIVGLVDSEDLPLNISREVLQKSQILKVIKKNLVKKSIELFTDLMEDDEKYLKFYNEFSKFLKLGIHQDTANKEKLAKLLRYHHNNSDDLISLDEYIKNMKEDSKNIYYIAGESLSTIQKSPYLETLKKNGHDVLLMVDPIDEYVVQALQIYEEKRLICITKEGLEIEKSEEEKENFTKKVEELTSTCEVIKEYLDNKVSKVVVTDRMSESPCCLVTTEYGWSANLERIMQAQALKDNTTMDYMKSPKILEINPDHIIIKGLKDRITEDKTDKTIKDLVYLLFNTAMLSSGFLLEDPSSFSKLIHRMVVLGLNMELDEDEDEDELPELEDDAEKATQDEEDSKMEEVD